MEELLKEALAAERRKSKLYLTALKIAYGNDKNKINDVLERAISLNKRFTSLTYKNYLISQSNKTFYIVVEDLSTGRIVKIIDGKRKFERDDLRIIGENLNRIEGADPVNCVVAEMEYNNRMNFASPDQLDTLQIPVIHIEIQ